MTPKRYQSIPRPVEVMQLTTDMWWDVARWCDGETMGASPHAVLKVKTDFGPLTAYEGDYIVRDEYGSFRPCSKAAFHNFYEEVQQ